MLTRYLLPYLKVACSVAAIACASQPALAETLEEAILKAYETNPTLVGTRALVNVSDERVTQAQAAYGPSVSLSASHDYTYSNTTVGGGTFSEGGWGTSGSVGLQQPLFTSGLLAAELDQAEAARLSVRQQLRNAQQQMLLDVVGAYVSVQRDIELYDVASDIYELLLEQRNATRARFNLRDATAPDVEQTENRLQLAAGRVVLARSNLEQSATRYRNVTGAYPEDLAAPPPLPGLPTLGELYRIAEANNPEILSAQFAELSSRADVASVRAARGPQVDGTVIASRSPLTPFENSRYVERIVAGVSMSVPLYSGGLLTSRVREAVQNNLAQQQLVEQTRRDVRESLANEWNTLRAAQDALPRYLAAVTAAQSAIAGVREQERAGLRTLRDLLDVTNDLLTARTSAVQAEADLYFRRAGVLRQAGLLTIDLFADRGEYDPESYDPGLAGFAGLPFGPLVEPLDRLLLNKSVKEADVTVEADAEYERGEMLPSPLEPLN